MIRVTFFIFLLASVVVIGQSAPSGTEATAATPLLPNLIPLPARDLRITWEGGQRLLKFTTTVLERGQRTSGAEAR